MCRRFRPSLFPRSSLNRHLHPHCGPCPRTLLIPAMPVMRMISRLALMRRKMKLVRRFRKKPLKERKLRKRRKKARVKRSRLKRLQGRRCLRVSLRLRPRHLVRICPGRLRKVRSMWLPVVIMSVTRELKPSVVLMSARSVPVMRRPACRMAIIQSSAGLLSRRLFRPSLARLTDHLSVVRRVRPFSVALAMIRWMAAAAATWCLAVAVVTLYSAA